MIPKVGTTGREKTEYCGTIKLLVKKLFNSGTELIPYQSIVPTDEAKAILLSGLNRRTKK